MAVIIVLSDFGAQENKICQCSHSFPIYLPWSDGARCHCICFLNIVFKPAFSLSSFTFIKKLFISSSFSFIRVVLSAWASLMAQRLKCLPAMWETGFDPWVEKIPWRRKWQPTPVFLPGESHGRRSLVGYSPRGRKESNTTERLHFHFFTLLSAYLRLLVFLLAILIPICYSSSLAFYMMDLLYLEVK